MKAMTDTAGPRGGGRLGTSHGSWHLLSEPMSGARSSTESQRGGQGVVSVKERRRKWSPQRRDTQRAPWGSSKCPSDVWVVKLE